ncbi:hypothetical protein EVAR_93506_1 [Eumeta japonica]|uniref:Uncharacterized protein n=1 Tax=Eumeta variegata TaxID=151549 RepID=A0A4C1TKJ8_EUMVA|nr:hypothetical protein EVAR_93506_1 [Eumeta japonica]
MHKVRVCKSRERLTYAARKFYKHPRRFPRAGCQDNYVIMEFALTKASHHSRAPALAERNQCYDTSRRNSPSYLVWPEAGRRTSCEIENIINLLLAVLREWTASLPETLCSACSTRDRRTYAFSHYRNGTLLRRPRPRPGGVCLQSRVAVSAADADSATAFGCRRRRSGPHHRGQAVYDFSLCADAYRIGLSPRNLLSLIDFLYEDVARRLVMYGSRYVIYCFATDTVCERNSAG